MAFLPLSEGEKAFILHGARNGFRVDGRACNQFRPFELEFGALGYGSGSASVRVGDTDVSVGVKCELDIPHLDFPNIGKIEFNIHASVNATPDYRHKSGDEFSMFLTHLLNRAYQTSYDLKALCIIPRQKCWKICIEVMILEWGGNLGTAISMAAQAALAMTTLPKMVVKGADEGNLVAELAENGQEYPVEWVQTPLIVSIGRMEDSLIVDPTPEEENCCLSSLFLAVMPNGDITATAVPGHGSFLSEDDTFIKTMVVASEVGVMLQKVLKATIRRHDPTLFPREVYHID